MTRAGEPIGTSHTLYHMRFIVRTARMHRYAAGVTRTAEITTTACAIGPSSLTVTSMRAS
jgi:hypothetical protein